MEISIDRIEVSGNELRYKPRMPRPLRKYFITDTFSIKYDSAIDLEKTGESILAIPIVSMVAPIAWAVGADVRVRELDATYLEAMANIKDIFRDICPQFSYSGNIHAEKAVVNTFGGSRTLLPFSGGVDSLTSYLRHKEEKPDLVLVCGVQVPLFEREYWRGMRSDILSIANRDGIKALFIDTSLLRDINFELLSRQFGIEWIEHIAGDLVLLGVCAPITAPRAIGTVLIAASHTADDKESSAARPFIDEKVSWAGVRVVHDGYELRRQQKLGYICQTGDMGYLSKLRVCRESVVRENCGKCEKCFRTIVGLTVEGVDPNNCNFSVDRRTFAHIKDCFIKGKTALDESRRFEWEGIQKLLPEHIDTDIHGSREFLEWFREFDLSKYKANRVRHFLWDVNRLYRNKRIKGPSIKRKVKSYYYIALSRLGLA
ncbi:MAG TPA: hypothetical protein G4O13_05390 [Dehalococcoidia bacterium]|nr:hypothetical protein [Dehalococcoidia bacterium]